MFSRTILAASIALSFVIVGLLVFVGCDDRNEADIPANVYTHQATFAAGSVLKHVYVDGNTAAVAAGIAGAIVLDVTNLNAITEIYRYEPSTEFARVERVVVSEALTFVGAYMPSGASDTFWGQAPVFDYTTPDSFIFSMGFNGPLTDLALVQDISSTSQTNTFWGTDLTNSDGLVGSRVCRDSDTSSWNTQCSFVPPPYHPVHGDPRGFGIRGELIAIANNLDGMHIEDVSTNTGVADLITPGFPYDCAWYGDYIIVADRYFVTIVNAEDVANPVVAGNLVIDGADRLMSVLISGHYAVVMDEYDGVYVVDLATPTDPKLVQDIRLNEPTSIAVEGNRLYITDEQAGLLIYKR